MFQKKPHLLVAKGAALDSLDTNLITAKELEQKIENLKISKDNTTKPLAPLFKDDNEYEEFKKDIV